MNLYERRVFLSAKSRMSQVEVFFLCRRPDILPTERDIETLSDSPFFLDSSLVWIRPLRMRVVLVRMRVVLVASSILRIRFVHFVDASRPFCGFPHFADSSFLWILRLMEPFPMELLGGSFQGIGPLVHDLPDHPALWLDNHVLLPMSR